LQAWRWIGDGSVLQGLWNALRANQFGEFDWVKRTLP